MGGGGPLFWWIHSIFIIFENYIITIQMMVLFIINSFFLVSDHFFFWLRIIFFPKDHWFFESGTIFFLSQDQKLSMIFFQKMIQINTFFETGSKKSRDPNKKKKKNDPDQKIKFFFWSGSKNCSFFFDPDQKIALFFLIRIKKSLVFFWSGSKNHFFFFYPDQKKHLFFLIRIKKIVFFFWSKNDPDHFLPKSLKSQMSFDSIDPWSPNRGISFAY